MSGEKPITSPVLMSARLALPEKTKMTSLTQEVIRRLRNTCRATSVRERVGILNTIMSKLMRSGYNEDQRKQIQVCGLKGYYRMVRREEMGGMRVNRNREEGKLMRRARKIAGASIWYKPKRRQGEGDSTTHQVTGEGGWRTTNSTTGQLEVEAVLFIPYTPGGAKEGHTGG